MYIKGVINYLNILKSENAGLMWADSKTVWFLKIGLFKSFSMLKNAKYFTLVVMARMAYFNTIDNF